MSVPVQLPTPIHPIRLTTWADQTIQVFVKRDDLIHPTVQGNKWRKLKYNLAEAKALSKDSLLTFGGAFSNHIHAMAAAGLHAGFKTIGIIRGDDLPNRSPTLAFAEKMGMQLVFVSRETYRQRHDADYLLHLQNQYPNAFIIPEGGSNQLALKGVAEMVAEIVLQTDLPENVTWCVPVGSGGTMAGMVQALPENHQLIGFPALKGDFVSDLVSNFLDRAYTNWSLNAGFHFGGFAKWTPDLLHFMQDFFVQTGILLDPIYNGKMWYGINQMIEEGAFPKGTTIMAIHTGGLQGIDGFRYRFKNQLPENWLGRPE